MVHDHRKGAASFWLAELGEPVLRRPLASDLRVDVAIVGAGLSGLWTARYLLERSPELKIAVLEREYAGFGASGRNGGWVSALFPVPAPRVKSEYGATLADSLERALAKTVDEVGRQVHDLAIECDFIKEGTLVVARNRPQWSRLLEGAMGSTGSTILDASGTARILRVPDALGAVYEPSCATVQPAKLVRGLADRVEELGCRIFESTEVSAVDGSRVVANGHTVLADHVVVAVESYGSELAGRHRSVLPLYSMMIATAPLSDAQYEAIGEPPTGLSFADGRNLVVYGQVTAGRRIAFGGRGAPYNFGSRISDRMDQREAMRRKLASDLISLLPGLHEVKVEAFWGGTIGISRDWFPRLLLGAGNRQVEVRGYAGDGVAMTNLMGRLIAGVVTDPDNLPEYLPILTRPEREWEPEPLRYLGINLGLLLTRAVDRLEQAGKPAWPLDRMKRVLIGR